MALFGFDVTCSIIILLFICKLGPKLGPEYSLSQRLLRGLVCIMPPNDAQLSVMLPRHKRARKKKGSRALLTMARNRLSMVPDRIERLLSLCRGKIMTVDRLPFFLNFDILLTLNLAMIASYLLSDAWSCIRTNNPSAYHFWVMCFCSASCLYSLLSVSPLLGNLQERLLMVGVVAVSFSLALIVIILLEPIGFLDLGLIQEVAQTAVNTSLVNITNANESALSSPDQAADQIDESSAAMSQKLFFSTSVRFFLAAWAAFISSTTAPAALQAARLYFYGIFPAPPFSEEIIDAGKRWRQHSQASETWNRTLKKVGMHVWFFAPAVAALLWLKPLTTDLLSLLMPGTAIAGPFRLARLVFLLGVCLVQFLVTRTVLQVHLSEAGGPKIVEQFYRLIVIRDRSAGPSSGVGGSKLPDTSGGMFMGVQIDMQRVRTRSCVIALMHVAPVLLHLTLILHLQRQRSDGFGVCSATRASLSWLGLPLEWFAHTRRSTSIPTSQRLVEWLAGAASYHFGSQRDQPALKLQASLDQWKWRVDGPLYLGPIFEWSLWWSLLSFAVISISFFLYLKSEDRNISQRLQKKSTANESSRVLSDSSDPTVGVEAVVAKSSKKKARNK